MSWSSYRDRQFHINEPIDGQEITIQRYLHHPETLSTTIFQKQDRSPSLSTTSRPALDALSHPQLFNEHLGYSMITVDFIDQAVSGFLNGFCDNTDLLTTTWLNFLPDLQTDVTQDSCFNDAIKAVSLMHLSRRTCMTFSTLQARDFYGKALKQASYQLNIHGQVKGDHLLGALILLDLYEVGTG